MLRPLLCTLLLSFTLPGLAAPATPPATAAIIESLGLSAADTPMRDVPGWAPRRVVVSAPSLFVSMVPDFREQLAAAAGDVELVFADGNGMAAGDIPLTGADAYIGFCSNEVMAAAGDQFRWLHNYTVGMDRCADLTEAQLAGRVFTNGKRLSGPSIADHAIAMVLSLARGLPAAHSAQADNRWDRSVAAAAGFGELQDKTLLVVGLGGIGTEVARRAHGLGMLVTATRRSSREGPDFVAEVGLPEDLLKLAAVANVVVNALPLTDETRGLFDADFFAAMPKGALFVSVGRGQSTVTADLVAALESGHLGGAGLDVTDPEPLPADSPLWQMPNVVITPHISAVSVGSIQRGAAIAVENLRRYVAGEALLNEVDMAAGY